MEKHTANAIFKIIVKTIFLLLGLWFLYLVRDVVVLFFLSVILTATLDPTIDRMERKMPRPLAVFLVYVVIIAVISLVVTLIAPPLISQLKDFSQNLPNYGNNLTHTFGVFERYIQSYGFSFDSKEFLNNIFGAFNQTSAQLFTTTVSVFHALISVIVVLSLTFYMSVKEEGAKGTLLALTPKKNRAYVSTLAGRIESKIGKWMVGQILLMVIVFALDFIALSIFKVPYALVLALLAGLLEIVPYLGPIISATLAALVGFMISPLIGFIVLITFTIIQQIESHIIVPQIMRKAVGLNPVVVILSLLVGAKLGGTLGAILSIPIATTLEIIFTDILNKSE